MHLRFLALCLAAFRCVSAQSVEADDEWLRGILTLKSSDAQSFQVRAGIGAGQEQIIADLSYAPPQWQCLILRDSHDGLPLMIAADGMVWLYDPVGGQILQIRAAPELLVVRTAGDAYRVAWGMRADFPDLESQTTFRLDFGSVMRTLMGKYPKQMTIDRAARTAAFAHEGTTAKLTIDQNDPPRPKAFSLESGEGKRRADLRFESFVYGAPRPKWHRELNPLTVSKHLTVRAARDKAMFSQPVQEKMDKSAGLMQGGGFFILRPMLRDAELRQAFEKNSPIKLDFDELKANDEAMRGPWLKALQEQGLEYPALKPQAAASAP